MSDTRRRRGRGGRGGHEPRARIHTREGRAIELMVLGWSQQQTAEDLGISQAAVSKLLKRVELRVLRQLAETLERHKVRHTLRLEHLYAEAMRAWEASKVDATRRRQRKTHGAGGSAGATVAEIVVENQHGDPRYLEEGRKALADLRKVWGLDAPQQLDVRASRNPYDGMSEEALRDELARQRGLLDDAVPVSADVAPIPPIPESAAAAEPSHPPDQETRNAEHP